jgi:GH15 family glucan-1,4-alpha-glucosidase
LKGGNVANEPNDYKPINDYGAIGNLRTVALVGLDGSIDWCCFPFLDNQSVFAALLDHRKGGRFRVSPRGIRAGEQKYLDDTNVLETLFETHDGRVVVTDFMPLGGTLNGDHASEADPELYRVVRCEGGTVTVDLEWSPRFDYARAETKIHEMADHAYLATSEEGHRLVLGGVRGAEIVTEHDGPTVRASIELRDGEQLLFTTRWDTEDPNCNLEDGLKALEQTIEAWHGWVHKEEMDRAREWAGPCYGMLVRSELALKLLVQAGTGAVAAAATTSLPETIEGVRNWDYRYSWIRDAVQIVQALGALGHQDEATDLLEWAERVSEAHLEEQHGLQIMYTLHGEADLEEEELDHLEGYRQSRPVRVGNAAAKQRQPDIHGELLIAAYELMRRGHELDDDIWRFLSAVADRACKEWSKPDDGIWEQRNGPRHYVYSKVMVWSAFDRAIQLHEDYQLEGDIDRWRKSREEIRNEVLAQGYDEELGTFVQAYNRRDPDASNLLIPLREFLPFDDPRVQGTIDTTLNELTTKGLVYRYRNDDGLPGKEGAFGLCTFWLVDALALSNRIDEADEIFEGMLGHANHVGLYAEQIDPEPGQLLGNFPQGFTHLGMINSALYLAHAKGMEVPGPSLIGTKEHRKNQQNG